MDYMRWAKTHQRVRLELAESGIPQVSPEEWNLSASRVALEVEGPYGHPDLISAIAHRYGVPPDCVVPVPGTSSANFIAMASVARRGETILAERPLYEPLAHVCDLLGLRALSLLRRPEDAFAIDEDGIRSALEAGARAVLLTNLHNPSGQYITTCQARRLAELCGAHDAKLVVDEVYLDGCALALDKRVWTAAAGSEHAVTTNSLTKIYGLAGLRIGWIIACPEVAERAREVMDVLSVNNPAPSMSLAIEAFQRMPWLCERYRKAQRSGRAVFEAWLARESRVQGYPSHGQLFECVRLPRGTTASRLADVLAREYETQVVPGDFFDLPDHVRIGLAPLDVLEQALPQVSRALDLATPAG